jgi:uncharacterized membrane protein
MTELIVITFDREADAEAAYDKVRHLQDDLVVELAGLALVRAEPSGRTKVETPHSGDLAAGAGRGALFGALLGLLFFIPFLGLAVGGALGALFAHLDRSPVNAEFRERVRAAVAAGRSAVVVYASRIDEERFEDGMREFGGATVRTSISEEEEDRLAHDAAAA